MTSEMLERARAAQQRMGVTNVEFHQATIDQLPIADQSVDVIISNCVINLVPDKLAVMREIWRVLKPGGRVAISDIALRQTLPENIKESMEAYVGCISGAVMIDEYRELLQQAGFGLVTVTDSGADLNAYALVGGGGCCGGICGSPSMAGEGSSVHDGITSIMQTFDANAYAASVKVHAIKGATQSSAPSSSNGSQLPVANFNSSLSQEKKMKTFQIYDKPMCCSTGVCGPEVDPVLPRFAADLDWLKQQGYQVDRFNLAQQPTAFIENKVIHQLLGTAGTDCLPVIVVDGQIVSQKAYPSRDQLAAWALGKPSGSTLPVSSSTGGCCGSSGCC
jgi:hypothetical protein